MAPDDVVVDLARVLRLVQGRDDGVDRAGPDRVAALGQADELADDDPRAADLVLVSLEREPVSAEADGAAEAIAEGGKDAVVDGGELGGDLVRDRQNFLQGDQV